MANQTQPITKDNTDEIREILEGCQTGKLRHDQRNYHCGTSHCIAGFKQVLDMSKEFGNEVFDLDFGLPMRRSGLTPLAKQMLSTDVGAYAQDAWGLSDIEAVILFHSHATFGFQFALLEWLESGKRVSEDDSPITVGYTEGVASRGSALQTYAYKYTDSMNGFVEFLRSRGLEVITH
jgi:hypothetical protein